MPAGDRSVDVLLVGGGVASVRCARTLRRHRYDGSILLVSAEGRAPYNRPPLSKELLREDLPDELLDAEPPSWYARRSIELRTDTAVTALEPTRRLATLADGTTVSFERCLLATGAELRRLQVPGGARALMLRTVADARRLRGAAIDAAPGAPVVVVGGGFIGLETASALAGLGLRPTVVEMAPLLWAGSLGASLAGWAAARLSAAGIGLRPGAAVTRVDEDGAWIGDELLPGAFVVAGIGVVPRVELAEIAGIEARDGITVDGEQRTSHPAVWAAGDVASVNGRRVEHWHAAREAGERAALSMLGLDVPDVPPAWVFAEVAGATLDVIGSVDGWEEERWIAADRLMVYLSGGRVVGVASIDGAVAAEVARRLVASGASAEDVAAAASV